VEKVKEIETLIKDPVSLSTSLNDEDDGTLEDLIADPNQEKPEDRIDNELRAKAINGILNTLDEREKDIIVARFGLNGARAKTLDELAAEYKLTKERIRQIEQKALHKLRNPARLEALKPHLN
jgi:RNA polymerase primary sigma factor